MSKYHSSSKYHPNSKNKAADIPKVITFDSTKMQEYIHGASRRKQLRRIEYQERQKQKFKEERISSRAEQRALARNEPEVLQGFPLPTKTNEYDFSGKSNTSTAKQFDDWGEFDDVISQITGQDSNSSIPAETHIESQTIYSIKEDGGLPGQNSSEFTTHVTVASLLPDQINSDPDHSDSDPDPDSDSDPDSDQENLQSDQSVSITYDDFDLSEESDSDNDDPENIGGIDDNIQPFVPEKSNYIRELSELNLDEKTLNLVHNMTVSDSENPSNNYSKQKISKKTKKSTKTNSNPNTQNPYSQFNTINQFDKELFIDPSSTVELERKKKNKKNNKKKTDRFAWNKNTAIKMRKKRKRSERMNKSSCKPSGGGCSKKPRKNGNKK